MRYFLDTNTIIYCLKDMYPSIKDHIKAIPSLSIAIPSIVKAEIEYGAQKSNDYEKTINKYNRFLDTFYIEPFDEECLKVYGEIRAELEVIGSPIGPNNLIIASIVIAKGGVLVTHNTKEFSKIKRLNIVDWTTK